MRTLLRGSLRAINYLLAIIGVLMVAYALFMYVEFTEAHHSVPAPPDQDAVASLHAETLGLAKVVHASHADQATGYPSAGWIRKASAETNASGISECVHLITHLLYAKQHALSSSKSAEVGHTYLVVAFFHAM